MAKARWLIISMLLIVISWSVFRDIQLEKQGPGDLRNRIVGARLQKDGRLPYFYKWKQEDGIRYYDPANIDSLRVSNITASPFFHLLLSPIADLPQRSVSRIWLVLEYIFFGLCVVIGLTLCHRPEQKMLVLISSILFLLTEGWKSHIDSGENYILFPLLMLSFIFFMRKTAWYHGVLAGLSAIILVAIRPNEIVFFIPFLFLLKNYRLSYKLSLLIPSLLLFVFLAGSKFYRDLLGQYVESISFQMKVHQGISTTLQLNDPDPHYANWEGWSTAEKERNYTQHPIRIYSENGNFFNMVRKVLKIQPGINVLHMLSIGLILLSVLIFYFVKMRTGEADSTQIMILGCCLFMISDLFSPIFRHQYYSVQWLAPLIAACSLYPLPRKWVYSVLALALGLNILNTGFVDMEHTIGEYMFLFIFLLTTFLYKPRVSNEGNISAIYQRPDALNMIQ